MPNQNLICLARQAVPVACSLMFAASTLIAAETPGLEVPAGTYDVTSQMIMPHLEEMRRITTKQQRCLQDEGAYGLFPVMDQPALRGCSFGFKRVETQDTHYLLVCQTARVATGSATLRRTAKGITGSVDIKMGGKNMTFSQRIDAVRAGACSAHGD